MELEVGGEGYVRGEDYVLASQSHDFKPLQIPSEAEMSKPLGQY